MSNLIELEVGGKKQLVFKDGGVTVTTLTYKSLNPKIATVTNAGLVTAVAAGAAVIVVTNTDDDSTFQITFKVEGVGAPVHNYTMVIEEVLISITAFAQFSGAAFDSTTAAGTAANSRYSNAQSIVADLSNNVLYTVENQGGVFKKVELNGDTSHIGSFSGIGLSDIALDGAGFAYVLEREFSKNIWKVNLSNGSKTSILNESGGNDYHRVAYADGIVYFSTYNTDVRSIDTNNGNAVSPVTGIPGTITDLNFHDGYLYWSEFNTGARRIMRMTPAGSPAIFATLADTNAAFGAAFSNAGVLYVAQDMGTTVKVTGVRPDGTTQVVYEGITGITVDAWRDMTVMGNHLYLLSASTEYSGILKSVV